MSKKMLLLFSHKLNNLQEIDAIKNLKVTQFIVLPRELQQKWCNFDADLEYIDLEPFKKFLSNNLQKGDIVLVQGDFGATFSIVEFALNVGFIPVYATTKREVVEFIEDGQIVKKSIFKHRRFRKYGV
ncbi:MAG: CRISPR-associated protein Csx20 [Arcobacteraceae bacterium]|nr:CRISPR-associated protein Csx20 [Arcobacteraceae bacterium]